MWESLDVGRRREAYRGVMSRRALVGMLAASAVLVVPAMASAKAFGPPVKLVGPTGSRAPVIVAASANGYEAFAWTAGVVLRPGGSVWVQARLRLPNGRLTPLETVSPRSGRAFLPVIGVDRTGDATVAWLQQIRGGNLALEVSVRAAGKRFTAPVVLGYTRVSTCCATIGSGTPGAGAPAVLGEGDYFGVGPALAVAPDGAAAVAWSGAASMQVVQRPRGRCAARTARACFSVTQSLPAGLQPQEGVPSFRSGASPRVVFGADDTAYLVWAGEEGLEVAVAQAGHVFGSGNQISAGTDVFTSPAIALTGGNAVLAWHWSGSVAPGVAAPVGTDMAVLDSAGTISTSLDLGAGAGAPEVLIDPHGQALIDWASGDGQLYEAVRATDGTVGSTTVIGTVPTDDPIVIDGQGNELLSYESGPYEVTFWQWRPPGGTFDNATSVPGSSGNSFLLLRTPDVITMGWDTSNGTMLADIRLGSPASGHRATIASASISTRQRGSRKPLTMMKPVAGRIAAKTSP
jgi:hypothetical protein